MIIKAIPCDAFFINYSRRGRIHYAYSISLIVVFSNGENETATVSGDIVMIEENSRWIVDIFMQS